MPEEFTPKSFRLPCDVLESLSEEAEKNLRNDTTQLIFILRERYARKPRLETKQQRGGLRK